VTAGIGYAAIDPMADTPDRSDLIAAVTTEHFTLQGARTQTVNESSSRAALYIGSVSSAVVALGFISQLSKVGEVFDAFALTVLPTLYLLGISTFVRLVENSAEDFHYGRAINRIRHYYEEVAGDHADLFLLSGHDDADGVKANMGVPFGRRQRYFTIGSAIAMINSVVAGSAVAIAAGAIGDPQLGLAVAIGAAVALVSLALMLRYEARLLAALSDQGDALFPSPSKTDREASRVRKRTTGLEPATFGLGSRRSTN
jgi:hypothetical protein